MYLNLKQSARDMKYLLIKGDLLQNIHFLMAVFILWWLNVGTYTYFTNVFRGPIKFLVLFFWFFLSLILNKRCFFFWFKYIWLLLVFVFILILSYIIVPNHYVEIITIHSISLLAIASIFLYYFDVKYIRYQRIILFILTLDIIYVAINTYFMLAKDPMVARYLAGGAESLNKLTSDKSITMKGLGSFVFFYAFPIFVFVQEFQFANHKKLRWFYLITIGLSFDLLLKAQFTTAILFSLVFTLLLIVCYFGEKVKYYVLSLIIFSLILFFVLPMMLQLLIGTGWLSDLVVSKLQALAAVLSGEDISSSLLSRRHFLFSKSLVCIKESYFLGVWSSDRIGGHSTILDTLGLLGIFAIPFFAFFVRIFMMVRRRLNSHILLNISWLYFLCLGLVNPVLYGSIMIMLFVFVPYYILVQQNEKNTLVILTNV